MEQDGGRDRAGQIQKLKGIRLVSKEDQRPANTPQWVAGEVFDLQRQGSILLFSLRGEGATATNKRLQLEPSVQHNRVDLSTIRDGVHLQLQVVPLDDEHDTLSVIWIESVVEPVGVGAGETA